MSLDNLPLGGEGIPPNLPGGPESSQSPEDRGRYERANALPIEGPDVIEALQMAEIGENGDIGELKEALEIALSFREGWKFGYGGTIYEINPEETRDIKNKQKIVLLQSKFTTVEGAVDRPNPTYIDIAIDEAINGRIRRAQAWHKNPDRIEMKILNEHRRNNRSLINSGRPELMALVKNEDEIRAEIDNKVNEFRNEYEAIPALIELSNHIEARGMFDMVFRIRMTVCENPDDSAKMGSKEKPAPSPDAPHWAGLLQTETMKETCQAIDQVLEEIVKLGMADDVIRRLGMDPIPRDVRRMVPSSIYVDGFKSGVTFGTWFNHLYKLSGERIDVVWNAWKLALATEVIDANSEKVNEKGEYELPTPPLGNALFTYIAHFDKKRKIELGLDASGKRSQIESFISHGGLPMSLGKIKNLCLDYFHEAKIEFSADGLYGLKDAIDKIIQLSPQKGDPDYDEKYDKLRKQILDCWRQVKKPDGTLAQEIVKITLWDLRFYGGLKFSDSTFPWFQTDQPDPDSAPGELPGGSWGGWNLKRSRSNDVQQDIRAVVPLQDLGDPTFFIKRVRNWTKVLGGLKEYEEGDPETYTTNNPRNWWLAGQLYYHYAGHGETKPEPLIKENPVRYFRATNLSQGIKRTREGREEKGVGIGDVLTNAVACGFIRKIDREWIEKVITINYAT